MARLLKSNPLKPDSTNLQERVIQRDREESGREAPDTENTSVKQAGVNEGVLIPASTDTNERESKPVHEEVSTGEGEDWREAVRGRARKVVGKRNFVPARINADIDEELHKQVRLHCIAQGIHIKQFLPALLEEYLKGVKD